MGRGSFSDIHFQTEGLLSLNLPEQLQVRKVDGYVLTISDVNNNKGQLQPIRECPKMNL
jgi:hypothetical protein